MSVSVYVCGPEGQVTLPLTFDGERVVLGRGASADVRLPDRSVSTRHATIRAASGSYVLVDEGSTNGSYVGGVRLEPLTPRALRSGDRVRLGRVWVEVRMEAAVATADVGARTRDLALALVAAAMRNAGESTTARIVVLEGQDMGQELLLRDEETVYAVGRDPSCDLVLTDPDASRRHVEVLRRGETVTVRDVGAKNAAAIGEAWLQATVATVWRTSSMLRVGRTVLGLEQPALAVLRELEVAEDEPVGEPPASAPASREESAAAVVAAPETRVRERRAPRWTVTDIVVAAAALAVLGLSAAGLLWLLTS